jgi:hypothetical protein
MIELVREDIADRIAGVEGTLRKLLSYKQVEDFGRRG